QIDPFYIKLLSDGEKSFLAKAYKEAVKELEIATFGLGQEKKLRGKAYAYLSLSYYYLKEKEKSEEYLRMAINLVGLEGFESLDISGSARSDIEKLVNYFKLSAASESEEITKAAKTPPKKKIEPKLPKKEAPKMFNNELEERIKVKPRNISVYYELYKNYINKDDLKAAKNALISLVRRNPNEDYAYLLLAKIEFSQKNYKDALQFLNKVLSPFDETQLDKDILIKSMIYTSVCFYYLNRKENIQSFVKAVEDATSKEQLIQILKAEGLEEDWKKIKE
ncbi:MAG: tetratricopeptide repeat protein, partial [Candidatus Aminicenantaceae bacterium]